MKRCPTCNRIYTDDGLSFCLEDGGLLVNTGGASGPSNTANSGFDPNATLQFDSVRDTSPPATQVLSPEQMAGLSASYMPPAVNTAPPPTNYTAPPNNYTAPPPVYPPVNPQPPVIPTPPPVVIPPTPPPVIDNKKKKSGLPWLVIGGAVIGVLVLGVIGILGLAAYLSDDNTNKGNTNNAQATSSPVSGGKESGNPPTASTGTFVDDFSSPRWPVGEAAQGSAYANGAYVMNFSDANRFAVVYAPANDANYNTDNAQSIKVEVTNLDGNAPQIGYGLVVNGSVANGNLLNGYAFLIETKSGQCLVAQLKNSVQSTVMPARPAPMLKKGTATNVLEVRNNGSKLDFYINGQLATSADNKGGATGRVGFYTSAGGPVAFDNLAIARGGGGKSWGVNN